MSADAISGTDPTPNPDGRFDLVVVGGGNMGAALVRGLLARDASLSMAIVEADPARREQLSEICPGVDIGADPVAATTALIAVKPPDAIAAAVAAGRAGAVRIVSIAAGITTTAFERALGERGLDIAVVRSMPNTPALVGQAMTAICAGSSADENDLIAAEQILGALGRCIRLDEGDFDLVTAVTGSGPAYVMLLAEALIDAGVARGLDPATAEQMVTQLLVGSAALLAAHGDPASLRVMVTSPGGTTAAGLAALQERGFAASVAAAVDAAARRSRELGA